MPSFRIRLKDQEIALPERGELVVGRDASCDIALEDRLVSRRHAAFRLSDDGALEIADLGSTNGVRVNDAPVKGSRALGHRDRVQIGSHVMLVLDASRDRRSSAPTTRATLARPAQPRAPATRPVRRASGRATSPLDTIAHALETGDLAAACGAMDAVIARYAEGSEPLAPGELARVTLLLLSLAERTGEARYFDRIFHIHTARREVLDAATIDALQGALPRLSPGFDAHAIETYLASMQAGAAALTTQDQVRLRRVATVARRVQRGAPS